MPLTGNIFSSPPTRHFQHLLLDHQKRKRASEGHVRCQTDVLHLHKGEWMSSIYNSVCRASYRQYDASCFFLARVVTLLAHPSISYWGLSVPQTRGLGRDPEGFDIQTSEL